MIKTKNTHVLFVVAMLFSGVAIVDGRDTSKNTEAEKAVAQGKAAYAKGDFRLAISSFDEAIPKNNPG